MKTTGFNALCYEICVVGYQACEIHGELLINPQASRVSTFSQQITDRLIWYNQQHVTKPTLSNYQ
jgi:hypothetical protein